jgi:hypothetical protein
MSRFLGYGEIRFPTQGSSSIHELVKHFESNESFDNLQQKINTWLILIGLDVNPNRPSIRTITFDVFEKLENPDKGQFQYFAQVHYMLMGDAPFNT